MRGHNTPPGVSRTPLSLDCGPSLDREASHAPGGRHRRTSSTSRSSLRRVSRHPQGRCSSACRNDGTAQCGPTETHHTLGLIPPKEVATGPGTGRAMSQPEAGNKGLRRDRTLLPARLAWVPWTARNSRSRAPRFPRRSARLRPLSSAPYRSFSRRRRASLIAGTRAIRCADRRWSISGVVALFCAARAVRYASGGDVPSPSRWASAAASIRLATPSLHNR